MHVAVVVVAHNGGELVARCVKALLATDHASFEVVVVDNGSSDERMLDLLPSENERLRLLRLADNLGFAGGVNAGIDFATVHGRRVPELFALINQDCFVRPGWLAPLAAVLEAEPDVAVVGGRILEPDGRTLQHAGGRVHGNGLTDHIGRGSRDDSAYRRLADVDYVCGALCAFRADTWRRFGPFDEGYFPAYYEEVDFCLRARASGRRIVYVPDSVALHREASSSGRGSRLFLERYHRNRLRFVVRHLAARGARARWARAELGWLLGRRHWHELTPVLRAYREVPRFVGELRAEQSA